MQTSGRSGEPVFIDRTGRRRRLFVVAGSVGGLVLVMAVLVLLAGFTGVGPGSVPGWPGTGQAQGAAPKPDPSVTAPTTADPRAGATASAAATPTPAGVARSTMATGAATTAAPPPPATPTPVTTSHRKVPTQTPTERPSKRH